MRVIKYTFIIGLINYYWWNITRPDIFKMDRKEYDALDKAVLELLCTNTKEFATVNQYATVNHSVIEMSDINVKKVSDEKYAPIVPIDAPVTLEWNSLNVAINVSLILYI